MELRLENVTHTYQQGSPFQATAIREISFTVRDGDFTALIGHTGSGKSTLAQHLNGLLKPTEGRVTLDGEDIHAKGYDRRQVRRQVGLVFQYPETQLFEETVKKDIAFGPKNLGLSDAETEERVRSAMALVGLDWENEGEKSPFELSGGKMRRCAIAGVIAMRPGILILDEPTAGLDPSGCRQILENICSYRKESGATVIIVSHNMDDAARLTERLIVFNRGTVAMDGTPEQVFSRPEELIKIGLSVPQATSFAMALREKGIPLRGSIYTHAQLMAALKEVGIC